jgi:Rrf2 family protein
VRLTGRTDYGLRAMLELAAADGRLVRTDDIAAAQDIPHTYLGAILAELRRAGLVRARRGPDGGWTLTRDPSEISLADVIRAIDGALADVAGTRPENLHYSGSAAGLQPVFVALRAAERSILEAMSLADVLADRMPARIRRLIDDPDAWH